MAELTPQERLQPALLDRLTDEEPGKKVEPREQRVLSLRRLREGVLRDLAWLLNTGNLEQLEDLTDFPRVRESVLNYGMRDLSGLTLSLAKVAEVEKRVREAVLRYEPRVVANTLKVRAVALPGEMNRHALSFQIEGDLWAHPVPLHLLLRTDLDLESGQLEVREDAAAGR
ncbi:MAG TPA: type VI secretion system baseplate subunit TssE [Polyangiaceae bacterium]|nr:type VI secretion system baseplate subunit TssE [Polyangiaceae bacterium]